MRQNENSKAGEVHIQRSRERSRQERNLKRRVRKEARKKRNRKPCGDNENKRKNK